MLRLLESSLLPAMPPPRVVGIDEWAWKKGRSYDVYHTCVTLLERELAAEPSEATRQAYASLLQKDTASPPQSIASAKQNWRKSWWRGSVGRA